MKSNFTPGPWRIGDKHQTDIYAARAGHAIARTVNPHYAGECEANAVLIAAAPELLEALEWLVDILPDPELDNDELQRVWTKKARAAINKATGGTT